MENKSKTNTVLLVIIIILLVVGLVYVFFDNLKLPPNNLPQENQNNVTNTLEQDNNQVNTILPTNITTSNTKGYSTYTSASYLYKFDYDSTRFISDYNPQGKEVSINNGDCISSECASLYKVTFINNVSNLTDLKSTIIQYLGANLCKSSNPIWSPNSFKIDNKETLQLNYSPCAGPHEGILKTILGTIYNGNGYIVSFVGQYGEEYKGQMKTEFDNLVSSFKFLKGAVTACDLKVTLSSTNPSAQTVASGTNNFKFMTVDLTAVNCDMEINNIDVSVGQRLSLISYISNLIIKDESNVQLGTLNSPDTGSNNIAISNLIIKKGNTKQINIFADIGSNISDKEKIMALGINVTAKGTKGSQLITHQLNGSLITIQ